MEIQYFSLSNTTREFYLFAFVFFPKMFKKNNNKPANLEIQMCCSGLSVDLRAMVMKPFSILSLGYYSIIT